jgi:DNA topoisomerase I
MPRLRRSDCAGPGIVRRRAGRGFAYFDSSTGSRVRDAATLARIRGLVLPPAWIDVWICADERGHIQAIGTDAKGRKQYRYHDHWRLARDREKFDRMLDFARALPRMRRVAKKHFGAEDMTRERVLACAVRLLDVGFFRVGGEEYADSYGLATILKSHVDLRGDVVTFDYISKGGKQRIQSVVAPEVVDVVRALKRRRGGGDELLAYRDGRRWVDVRSSDINAYIKEIGGGDFTAKDFRTWTATVIAAVALAVAQNATKAARKRAIANAIKEASHYLGNTPAVCRASYVDPRVIDRYLAGVTVRHVLPRLGERTPEGTPSTHGAVEAAVIDLLADAQEANAA